MMLEEMQDAKAYPLVRPRPNPGMTWPEMAALEMRANKMMAGAKPKPSAPNQHSSYPDRAERIIAALKIGSMTCQQLADAIGVHRRTANDYARRLEAEGRIVSFGAWGGSYRLAEQEAKVER